jgi:Type IV secretion system pilin
MNTLPIKIIFTKLIRIFFSSTFLFLFVLSFTLNSTHISVLADDTNKTTNTTTKPSNAPLDPCLFGPCIGQVSRYKAEDTPGERASLIIIDIATVITYVGAAIAVIYVVLQGFKMVTANGDAKKYEQSLKGIVYAIFGLIVMVISYGIIASVVNIVGGWK